MCFTLLRPETARQQKNCSGGYKQSNKQTYVSKKFFERHAKTVSFVCVREFVV
jgi:hypothetical protein